MTNTDKRYNVQCQSGHVSLAPVGSELEQKCIEREEAGFLDALCLSAEECVECQQELERINMENSYMCDLPDNSDDDWMHRHEENPV